MNPEYYLLPVALICLWLPAVLISSASVQDKLRQQVRRHDDGFLSLLPNWVNWFDLCRSAAGAWMLQRVVTAFSVGQDDLAVTIMLAQFAILFIGVVAQTIWFSQKPLIIGPAFYLIGLTVFTSGMKVGFFALALGYVSSLMLRRLSLSFYFVPASLVVFSALFHKLGLTSVFNVAVYLLPSLLSFILGERIAFARRPTDSKQVGYVYGGTASPYYSSTVPFPPKEDVPDRNFGTPNRHSGSKTNEALREVVAFTQKTG